ncbi:hypothetical protein AX16_005332 [Volvariella volvacea WC 439]|nr:hypothetical protein AX16_005332 [Volvariella volvacea WC 439]
MPPNRITLQIVLNAPFIRFKGVGVDVEPDDLSGRVLLYLPEDTSVKQISLSFKGKAVIPTDLDARFTTYPIFDHDWKFLEGEQRSSRTLRAGYHAFPFHLELPTSLPSSISSTSFGDASISYELNAQVLRSGFNYNVYSSTPVFIVRTFGQEVLEYQQTLDIEGTWPDKIMYSFMLPHKAWAAGDHLTALVKLSPLGKGVRLLKVVSTIREFTQFRGALSREHMMVVSMAKHEFVNGRLVQLGESGQDERGRSGTTTVNSNSTSPHSSSQPPVCNTSLPPSMLEPDGAQDEQPSLAEIDDLDLTEDTTTVLSIPLPPHITPTHLIEPITVSHRVQWSIYIENPDGHTSELRCSLPLHLLDNRLLEESQRFTAPIRRIVLGDVEGSAEATNDLIPPNYSTHVQDLLVSACTCRRVSPQIEIASSPAPTPCRLAVSEAPGYEFSTRRFVGTVPPLEFMQGLPSYEAAQPPKEGICTGCPGPSKCSSKIPEW